MCGLPLRTDCKIKFPIVSPPFEVVRSRPLENEHDVKHAEPHARANAHLEILQLKPVVGSIHGERICICPAKITEQNTADIPDFKGQREGYLKTVDEREPVFKIEKSES